MYIVCRIFDLYKHWQSWLKNIVAFSKQMWHCVFVTFDPLLYELQGSASYSTTMRWSIYFSLFKLQNHFWARLYVLVFNPFLWQAKDNFTVNMIYKHDLNRAQHYFCVLHSTDSGLFEPHFFEPCLFIRQGSYCH